MKKEERIFKNEKNGGLISTISYIQFVQGFFITIMGAILPYLREEYQLSYSLGGSLVSIESFGKLAGSFAACYLAMFMGAKKAMLIFNATTYVGFVVMALSGKPLLLVFAFILLGIGHGTTVNFSSDTMNRLGEEGGMWMTFTQSFFALGSLLAPLLTSLFMDKLGLNWRVPDMTVVFFGVIALIVLGRLDLGWYDDQLKSPAKEAASLERKESGFGFLKYRLFWICTIIGFLYCAFEASLWAWATSYFLECGTIKDNMAQIITAMLWGGFFVGRLLCSSFIRKIKSENLLLVLTVITLVFYLIMINCNSLIMLIISVVGVGLGISGVFTVNIAGIGDICKKYPAAMGTYMPIALVGAVVAPALIGFVADEVSLSTGMYVLVIVAALQLLFTIINIVYRKRSSQP